ncbi:hypothetical protein FKM82_007669 [Ascaphus truei]
MNRKLFLHVSEAVIAQDQCSIVGGAVLQGHAFVTNQIVRLIHYILQLSFRSDPWVAPVNRSVPNLKIGGNVSYLHKHFPPLGSEESSVGTKYGSHQNLATTLQEKFTAFLNDNFWPFWRYGDP